MDNVAFEEIREEHIDEVLAIYTHYVQNTSITFHMCALSKAQMRDMLIFDNPRYKTYVIKTDGVIAGYVSLHQYKTREAYRDTAEVTVYLKPELTGKGLGNTAVRFIENFAVAQNMHVLIASICGENRKSIALFENNGYQKCGHYKEVGRKFGQLLDVVSYQKILSSYL